MNTSSRSQQSEDGALRGPRVAVAGRVHAKSKPAADRPASRACPPSSPGPAPGRDEKELPLPASCARSPASTSGSARSARPHRQGFALRRTEPPRSAVMIFEHLRNVPALDFDNAVGAGPSLSRFSNVQPTSAISSVPDSKTPPRAEISTFQSVRGRCPASHRTPGGPRSPAKFPNRTAGFECFTLRSSGQQRDVRRGRAGQARDRDHVQPVEQVEYGNASRAFLLQVPVRRGDDTNIRRDRTRGCRDARPGYRSGGHPQQL